MDSQGLPWPLSYADYLFRNAPSSSSSLVERIIPIGVLDKHTVFKPVEGEFVGCGSHGLVVFGYHPHYGRVAIKSPRFAGNREEVDQLRRFRREANLWKELRHPNVLGFIGIIDRPKRHEICLISEFASNGCLPTYLRRNPGADRLRLAAELAYGLEYLHSRDIIHGDIKGSNILVSAEGQVKVADFGLAKLVDTTTSTVIQGMGSLMWQAPELLELGRGRSHQSDVYAFGLTLYEILNGNPPFLGGSTQFAIVQAILNNQRPVTEPLQSPSGQSYKLAWDIAVTCWAPNPLDRPDISRICLRFSEHCLPPPDPQGTTRVPTRDNIIPFIQQPVPLFEMFLGVSILGLSFVIREHGPLVWPFLRSEELEGILLVCIVDFVPRVLTATRNASWDNIMMLSLLCIVAIVAGSLDTRL